MGAVVIVGSLGRETAYGEVSGLSCPESWLMPGAAGTTFPQDWWVTLEMEIVASKGIYFTSAFSLGTFSFLSRGVTCEFGKMTLAASVGGESSSR